MREKEPNLANGPDKVTVTVSFDNETAAVFKDLKRDLGTSQSELMRSAVKFYSKHRDLIESGDADKVYLYSEMLSDGEHVILDMDHWILFLNLIESDLDKDKFWEMHRRVSQAHAEEFINKNHDIEVVLRRLEVCNLFKLSKASETDFTLILGYNVPKKFIKTELEAIFSKMGCRAEIKEDLSKIRIRILPSK